jgi:hypothetical protein
MIKKYDDFLELVNERSSDIKFGCLMIYFDISRYDFYKLIEEELDPEDIYSYGIENEPHITILYGFHKSEKVSDIREKCNINPEDIDIKWGDISLFENEYDVLKISLESKKLKGLNEIMRDNFKYTSDFKDYKAHLTISYLKKGTGKKYLSEKLKNSIIDLLKDSKMFYVYSTGDSVKTLWV